MYLTGNAAERALKVIALGRKAFLFAGSDRGGQRATFIYSLIVNAKLDDVNRKLGTPVFRAILPNIPVINR
ncbi:IS66 family transposase [Devosia sp. Leaf420]|uniref:IS66 family transposase n=1 Tax=Devosia sp. Leaf420 TaxID=1736374 RepID=UPI0019108D31